MNAPIGSAGSFHKLQALGNDFVLIDARSREFDLAAAQIMALANRRTGIGFDQMLVLRPGGDQTLAYIDIFNADGSRAEQCGNGMRAIAAWLDRTGELSLQTRVDTPAGAVTLGRSPDGGFTADLPGPEPLDRAALDLPAPTLPAIAGQWELVSLGNPHLIIDWPESPTAEALAEVVAALEPGPWNGRVNVGLMHVEPESVMLRVHERGAGPTLACGSAACAAAWIARRANPDPAPVVVRQPGGTLVVDLASRVGRAVTSGQASVVFEGKIA
ncbi:MAG: diaminopimelate epimerase [Wenzhouxiangellaceae bacterium]